MIIVSLLICRRTTASVLDFLKLVAILSGRKMDCIALFCIVSKDVMKKKEIASVAGNTGKGEKVSFQTALLTKKGNRRILLVLEEEEVTIDMVSTAYYCLQGF